MHNLLVQLIAVIIAYHDTQKAVPNRYCSDQTDTMAKASEWSRLCDEELAGKINPAITECTNEYNSRENLLRYIARHVYFIKSMLEQHPLVIDSNLKDILKNLFSTMVLLYTQNVKAMNLSLLQDNQDNELELYTFHSSTFRGVSNSGSVVETYFLKPNSLNQQASPEKIIKAISTLLENHLHQIKVMTSDLQKKLELSTKELTDAKDSSRTKDGEISLLRQELATERKKTPSSPLSSDAASRTLRGGLWGRGANYLPQTPAGVSSWANPFPDPGA